MIDLHTHTSASDGTLTPTELVGLADDNGLSALAITDHDTIGGLDEAIAAAKNSRVMLIPGIELSAQLQGGTLHIVGLYIDHRNPAFLSKLTRVLEMRTARNPLIVERLRELGYDITLEEVTREAGGEVVGRPHFARILVKRRIVPNIKAAFDQFLGTGGEADVHKERLSPQEAIELIALAGGVSILAHPAQTKRSGKQFEALLKDLVDAGLKGIEVICPGHDSGSRGEYERLARHFGLAMSGGSDFHSTSKPNIRLGHGSGGKKIPDRFLQSISALAKSRTSGVQLSLIR